MARTDSYIPGDFDGFYNWEKQFMSGVQGLIDSGVVFPPQMISEFNALKALRNVYDPVHVKAADKSSRTPAETQKRITLRPPFRKALGEFAQMWFVDNKAIDDDTRRDLGLTVKDTEPTDAADITAQVFYSRQQMGGGVVWFRCRAKDDSKKVSKLRRNVDIEMRIKIGGEASSNPADYGTTHIAGRASFRYDFGVENAGSAVHIMMRWRSRTGNKFGPWNAPASFKLGD